MHRALLLMTLIASAVSRNEEEQCRDMFESIIERTSLGPASPQYCRGVSHFNNVLKLTSPITLQGLEKKKKRREELGRPCECMQLEVIWKIRCVRCEQDPDSNVTVYESHLNVL
ncbi:hypothetical protein EUTSA_v10026605mg [Eutrema salsugineum]|uniref:Uncharacterized protein n=1 Tax=Eutrema salsugineum TaxID=72664 RepID=V4MGJ9_EUTSA|nr:protein ARABIDOPSIS THALIANA ANTHER 7 [Eutrema salsugineum]ESQ54412.1 hypothetical protein EUTSA_v10026605mg [Eutrema salsugineum]